MGGTSWETRAVAGATQKAGCADPTRAGFISTHVPHQEPWGTVTVTYALYLERMLPSHLHLHERGSKEQSWLLAPESWSVLSVWPVGSGRHPGFSPSRPAVSQKPSGLSHGGASAEETAGPAGRSWALFSFWSEPVCFGVGTWQEPFSHRLSPFTAPSHSRQVRLWLARRGGIPTPFTESPSVPMGHMGVCHRWHHHVQGWSGQSHHAVEQQGGTWWFGVSEPRRSWRAPRFASPFISSADRLLPSHPTGHCQDC